MQRAKAPMRKRPVLAIPRTPTERILDVVAVMGVVYLLLITVFYWSSLPDRVPSHFGVAGKPDAWSGKGILWLLPVLSVVLGGGLSVLSRYPHIYNYLWQITERNARQQYQIARSMVLWLRTEIIWLFAFIQWQMIQVALGQSEGWGEGFIVFYNLALYGTLAYHIVQGYRAR